MPSRIRGSSRLPLVLLVSVGTAVVAPGASGQEITPPPARVLARLLVGEVALEFRTGAAGALAIGAAGDSSAVSIDVLGTDARRWADSAARLLLPVRRRPARGAPPVIRHRALLEEPGVGGGALDLVRTDSGGRSSYSLFVGDAALESVRYPLTADEARTVVRVVRRAALEVIPRRPAAPRSRRAPPPKKLL